jgi:molybdopterin synthase sulfur carrier subunit
VEGRHEVAESSWEVSLVYSGCFVYLVHLVCFVQPNKRDKPNKPNNEVSMVTVLVFGLTLRDAVGEAEFELAISEPTTVRKLIESNQDRMGPLMQFLANREVMIAVNKKVSAEDTVVKDGDIVKLSHQSRVSYDGTRDIPI